MWGGGGKAEVAPSHQCLQCTGTCLPAVSAPTSSISGMLGSKRRGTTALSQVVLKNNVSSTCVYVAKILAFKLARGLGKVCAWGIYRK